MNFKKVIVLLAILILFISCSKEEKIDIDESRFNNSFSVTISVDSENIYKFDVNYYTINDSLKEFEVFNIIGNALAQEIRYLLDNGKAESRSYKTIYEIHGSISKLRKYFEEDLFSWVGKSFISNDVVIRIDKIYDTNGDPLQPRIKAFYEDENGSCITINTSSSYEDYSSGENSLKGGNSKRSSSSKSSLGGLAIGTAIGGSLGGSIGHLMGGL